MAARHAFATHLAIALPLTWLCVTLAFLGTSADPSLAIRALAPLHGMMDERTRRYVLCLAIPLLCAPAATALWLAPEAARWGCVRFGHVVAKTLLVGLAASVAFRFSVEFALATAPVRPGPIARFTLSNAWLAVLVWFCLYPAIALVVHAATIAILRRGRQA